MKPLLAMLLLLAVISIACWIYRPGGIANPHEWLNETMKQELLNHTGEAQVSLGKWSPSPASNIFQIEDVRLSIVAEVIKKANYSMLEVTTPSGRCFSADICLKHGELKMRPCTQR